MSILLERQLVVEEGFEHPEAEVIDVPLVDLHAHEREFKVKAWKGAHT
jgi:hypothetical protein